MEAVRAAVDATFPSAPRRRLAPFGSYVHGIGLPGADLDLVVSGLMSPIARGGGERWRAGARLHLLAPGLAGTRGTPAAGPAVLM